MSITCVGMLLGLGGGVFITSPTILAVGQKAGCSVIGRTGHANLPLMSVAVSCWIRLLSRLPMHTGQSGATAPRAPCWGLSAQTAHFMNLFTVSFGLLLFLSLELLRLF
jgi:hypothetical protein